MGKEELKPCPFCGSDAEMERDNTVFAGQIYSDRYPNPVDRQRHGFRARCSKCGCQTCWWHYQYEAEVAWNARHNAMLTSAEERHE